MDVKDVSEKNKRFGGFGKANRAFEVQYIHYVKVLEAMDVGIVIFFKH